MSKKTAPVRAPLQPKPELEGFARNLTAAMVAKGVSNSDLARHLWGTIDQTDAEGRVYQVARNRDRIGKYKTATGFPEPATLLKMAEYLETTPQALAPGQTGPAVKPEFSVNMAGGLTDRAHVYLDAILPLATVMEIGRLYQQSKTGKAHFPGIDTDIEE